MTPLSAAELALLEQQFDEVEKGLRIAREWSRLLGEATKGTARRQAHQQTYRELAGVVSRCIQLQGAVGDPPQ